MADAVANFATSNVATAPSPATSGTSLVVTTGQGSRFPTAPFNAVICPADSLATPANAEIVRVTARSTDTLTITRATESSSARSVGVGDRIYAGLTKKSYDDKQDADPTLTALAGTTIAADKLIYGSGADAFSTTDLSSFSRGLLDETSAANWQSALDVYSTSAVAFIAASKKSVDPLSQTGYYAPNFPGVGTQASPWPTANRAYFHRFAVEQDITMAGMAFYVSTAATNNDAVDVGIYSWSGSTLTKIASSGATSSLVNSTGLKYQTFASTVALSAGGSYYAAMSYGSIGGTAAIITFATVATAQAQNLFAASTLGKSETLLRGTSHPLAGSYNSSLDYNWQSGPRLAVRSS